MSAIQKQLLQQTAPVGIFALAINADPSGSLGGSVARDIKNVKAALANYKHACRNISQYSFYEVDAARSLAIQMRSLYNDMTMFRKKADRLVTEGVEPVSILVVYVSGHGFQLADNNGDEEDGADEAIRVGGETGVLRDDDLKSVIFQKLAGLYNFAFAVADTCTSGTIFDLKHIYSFTTKKWSPAIPDVQMCSASAKAGGHVFAIAACIDGGKTGCDVGDNGIGFGGALTVHMLSVKYKSSGLSLFTYIIDSAVAACLKVSPFPISGIINTMVDAVKPKVAAAASAPLASAICISYE